VSEMELSTLALAHPDALVLALHATQPLIPFVLSTQAPESRVVGLVFHSHSVPNKVVALKPMHVL